MTDLTIIRNPKLRLPHALAAGLALALAISPAAAQNSGGTPQPGAKPAIQPGQQDNQQDNEQESKADLPSIETLSEMVTTSIGGREAFDSINTLHTVMSMTVMEMDVTIENMWSREGGRITKSVMPMGETMIGTDGQVGWMRMGPSNYQLMDKEQTEQFQDQASMLMNMMDLKEAAKNMEGLEVVGREEFNGRDCYKVGFGDRSEGSWGYLYFDASDGRPQGHKSTESTPMGEDSVTMTLSEWKPVKGVQFAHAIKVETPSIPGGSAEMKVTSLEVNELDQDVFALPEQVKEMAAAENAEGDADGNSNEADEGTDEISLEDLPETYREQAQAAIDEVKTKGKQAIVSRITSLESFLGNLPAGNDRLTLEYIIQELKKLK